MSEQQTQFEGWAILELMGHRRLAGWLSEQQIAGTAFVRIDIPLEVDGRVAAAWAGGDAVEEPGLTQFYAPSSVYAITPTTREVAEELAKRAPQPLSVWDVRALLPDIQSEVRAQIENEVREEAWKKQRQVTNVYTAGKPDEYEEPAF